MKKTATITLTALVVCAQIGCAGPPLPPTVAKPGTKKEAEVTLSDGTVLHGTVLLPKGEGPFPTVLIRMPYPMESVMRKRCRFLNEYGYACIFQEVRGRGASEGEWQPFSHEPDDGRQTLQWIAAQPWCDGNIAMMGESYLGGAAWAAAHSPPPELKTIIPTVFGTDLPRAIFEGGMFRHDIGTAWMSLMPGHEFRYFSGSRHYHRALRQRPRDEMDVVSAGRDIQWFDDWLGADRPDAPFWQREDVRRIIELPEKVQIPVLAIAGWSDAFLGPQISSFERLATRDDSVLVIGPWDHVSAIPAAIKQRGLDDEVGLSGEYSQWPRVLDWLDHHLKGEPLRYPAGGVASYVVNGGGWVWYETWPPPTVPQTLNLAPGQDPQRCTGALTSTAGSGEVQWTYDPEDPTPSHGGAGVLAGAFPLWRGAEPGFLDQKKLCDKRQDLVGFVSDPLPESLHVAGPLSATIRVASDAPDTAFNIRFLEQRPDGKRIHVRETILALSHRDGESTEPYTPGTVVTLSLETWPVEYVFAAGSQVLVEVGSASFPKYEAHSNTTEPWAKADRTPPADQRLVLEGSTVSLPMARAKL